MSLTALGLDAPQLHEPPAGRVLHRSNAAVIAAVTAQHAELAARLALLTRAVRSAARAGDYAGARNQLQHWCRTALVPHLVGDERTLYTAAAELTPTQLLVSGMLTAHSSLGSFVADLSVAFDAVDVVAAAAAGEAVLAVQLRNEKELLLPVLDAAGLDLAVLLGSTHPTRV
ncbi:MAG TPA: hemerythrin domain-containing protein [Jatrophihabitans sp.]|nr:hemerythrin domain-containing protein [Jatrophihabitans sp.]